MNDTLLPPALAALAAARPYFEDAADLVASAIAFVDQVEHQRPEVATWPGSYVISLDLVAKTIVVAKSIGGSRAVLVERVLVDSKIPATFGVSDLPMVEPDYGPPQ